jgi:dihydroneopterin aldolase
MSDVISIKGISAIGYHGVFPEERRDGQIFSVDLELRLDLVIPGASDDVTTTVDYSAVAALVAAEIAGEPVNLIEKLATRISNSLLEKFPLIDSIHVTVHKPDAPVGITTSDISVSIERFR